MWLNCVLVSYTIILEPCDMSMWFYFILFPFYIVRTISFLMSLMFNEDAALFLHSCLLMWEWWGMPFVKLSVVYWTDKFQCHHVRLFTKSAVWHWIVWWGRGMTKKKFVRFHVRWESMPCGAFGGFTTVKKHFGLHMESLFTYRWPSKMFVKTLTILEKHILSLLILNTPFNLGGGGDGNKNKKTFV